ncbi:MAG: threonine synthase [Saprospiraceae bacterium]
MQLYSTKNPGKLFSLSEAVLKGLPDDNGLFMPSEIKRLPDSFFSNLESMSFQDLSFEVARNFIGESIEEHLLKKMVYESINFPAPLVELKEGKYILELFHGPTMAFKDFGARFMAQLMSHFNQKKEKDLIILVATSGDTGGAVASGFYNVPGIKVVILYPSGKVSNLQEKQLTTLNENITALEIDGTFDDCQQLVKTAFLDAELKSALNLSSANSINIARLIPQSFYYFEAYKQLKDKSKKLVFSVPSGNFGNLTAGLLAAKMGLPVYKFLAATNINKIVPDYLETGIFEPKPSKRTLSNAMDVGNPSNFSRMLDLHGSTWNNLKNNINGYSFTDEQTIQEISRIQQEYNYTIDPHGAVGTLALEEFLQIEKDINGIVLETAHPAKFKEEMSIHNNIDIPIPQRLKEILELNKTSVTLANNFSNLKSFLLKNLT